MNQKPNEDFLNWEDVSEEYKLQAEQLLKELDATFNEKRDKPCENSTSTE